MATGRNTVAGGEAQSSAQAGAAQAASLPPPSVSHYALLRLSPDASSVELRQAFRSLSKRYHPDTTSLPGPLAAEQFRRLQLAYATLSDPERRRRYDAELQRTTALAAVRLAQPAVMAAAPAAVRRALSGGEWFALLLLLLALLLSLVLGLGLAWARGTALVIPPSWWPAGQTAKAPEQTSADGSVAFSPNAALQPFPAEPGELAAGAGGPPAGGESLPLGSAPAPLERPH